MANSREIEILERRVELAGQRIAETQGRQWTHYLTLDPLRLGANLFGGGDVGRDRIAIADLEIQAATLEQRQAAAAHQLRQSITALLVELEQQQQAEALGLSRLVTHQQRVGILEVQYRYGAGSTEQMLPLWQRTEELEAAIATYQQRQGHIIRTLAELVGQK